MSRPGQTSGSASNLMEAVKELRIEWDNLRGFWRDAKAAEFEHRYLENLPHDAARAVLVMKELGLILRKIRTDCE